MRFSFLSYIFVAFIMIDGLSGKANAQVLAGDITCVQAVAYREARGRIHIRRGNEILTIYRGVPVSQHRSLRCGRFDPKIATMLRKNDRASCTIFWPCR